MFRLLFRRCLFLRWRRSSSRSSDIRTFVTLRNRYGADAKGKFWEVSGHFTDLLYLYQFITSKDFTWPYISLSSQISVCPLQNENGHHTDNHIQPRVSDWEVAQEAGLKLKAVYGSGYTGMKNLGNSCYLSTTMQVLFSIPEFQRAWVP